MPASDFPLFDVFLTVLLFFLLLLVTAIIVWCLFDNLRRRDHGGLAKAGWTVLIVVLPLVGCLVYAAARPPGGMSGMGGVRGTGGPMALA